MRWLAELLRAIADSMSPAATLEMASPKIRIDRCISIIGDDGVLTVTGLKGCYLAALEPSNSMEPGIDDGMYVVLDTTIPHTDLIVGDIIYYEVILYNDSGPTYKAIHRIITIGNDKQGWFATTRGDNNSRDDGIKVRPTHYKSVWRATIN